MPLALVGMPGGGKSTVGRQLARRLGWSFLDADAVIEERLGEPIRALFERVGEAPFRALEEEVIDELTRVPQGRVIATGGGACLREANRRALHERCIVIYLRSTPEELFRRLRHDTHRPLLQVKDPLARLRELYAVRDPLYRECAHFIVETGRPSVPTLVNMVLMQLELAGALPAHLARSPVDPPRQ
ncbi:shikimate kinase [Piscinibacter sp.]|uniref:shikimate kinase n=1 Tax=Piscinibacter sp. TaxID=1903157 RepID=UPI0039E3E4C1